MKNRIREKASENARWKKKWKSKWNRIAVVLGAHVGSGGLYFKLMRAFHL